MILHNWFSFSVEGFASLPRRLFWWYVGLMNLMLGIGVWPWICYQFWHNTGIVIPNLGVKPESSSQRLMYDLATSGWPKFEYALECFK